MQYFKDTFMFLGIAYDVLMGKTIERLSLFVCKNSVCLLKTNLWFYNHT